MSLHGEAGVTLRLTPFAVILSLTVGGARAETQQPASLVACIAGEPKCATVRSYPSMATCEAAVEYLRGSWLTRDFPLHCEEGA